MSKLTQSTLGMDADPEDSLALVTQQRRDLAAAMVTAINEAHERAVKASHDVEGATDRLHEATREVGTLILEAQQTFGQNRFQQLIGRFLGFHELALRSYVVIASRKSQASTDFKSKWQSLRDAAARPVGLIP